MPNCKGEGVVWEKENEEDDGIECVVIMVSLSLSLSLSLCVCVQFSVCLPFLSPLMKKKHISTSSSLYFVYEMKLTNMWSFCFNDALMICASYKVAHQASFDQFLASLSGYIYIFCYNLFC